MKMKPVEKNKAGKGGRESWGEVRGGNEQL